MKRICKETHHWMPDENTGKWIHSSQSVNLGSYWEAVKAVYAKGVIYWRCGEYLLWYDTKRDLAGSVMLPAIEGTIDVGVYASEIMFCRAWDGGIEVWRLTGGSRWDRLHATSWDGMLDAFDLCHSQSEMFFSRHNIIPVEFDGQFVYIVVRLRNRYSTPRLFRWETETGRTEDKGPINLRQTWYHTKVFKYANSMARVPQILNGTF
ncbi:putative F-box protein [Carex littledalei]|uniref:Putative F-box protein n=1 Tax=Carex littledalei TaxID=544730 RepID=A0A833RU67_9POAL|nr:putative F-box protein [Carex littledalei]